ncbi:YppF family protein [Oceanobacillus caeni]|uniref:YppF family protein n=1 Tax=Bacillaceae TaxID=186817 RepID=UPI000621C71B|nr:MULTISPECIES: YppF family protein [Bacillaceae]KKE78020.1 hypothetical protein WH51_14890 [Bacilli bacterium VT-13-104]PZD84527.1 hypothetical protein DEJ64_11845 [Bacilli bacterium]MBU8790339.1 YppF family protein [Oceanobacillus caeni]MCR1834660.1 YppF family protein [Oceanobacillus caeni]MED4476286.1 YppF family protein [Oceanobacillus caeni]
MHIFDLVDRYMSVRNHMPDSVNDLLDFYQHKYIMGEIDIKDYRHIFAYLHKQGAISAFDYERSVTY